MRSRTVLKFILGLALLLPLLLPLPGFSAQSFVVDFDGFEDFNGNGSIDCSETVRYRVALVQASAPVPETGTISMPFSAPVRWSYIPGSVVPDVAALDDCTLSILEGNGANDVGAVLSYSCDPQAGDPLDQGYFLQFRISGRYSGSTVGPIIVDALNDRTSPSAGSIHAVGSAAVPLNPCPAPPDLRLAKRVLSGTGSAGSVLVYELSVASQGSVGASSVVLQETVPQLTSFDAASSSAGWSCAPNGNAGSACTLSLGSLAVGATATRDFAVRVAASFPPGSPATIDNTACTSSVPADDPVGNNCASTSTPAGNPDLALAKSVVAGNGNPGATLVYNLAVSNLGLQAAAGVQITETVPALSTFLPGSSSPGWSCAPNNSAGATCTSALGTLAAGAPASRTFAVQLAATFPSNPPAIDNTACVSTTTAGDPGGNNCGSVSTVAGGIPDLGTTKSVVSGSGDPGATLVYSLVVANTGSRDAAGAQLTETVPVLSTFLPGSSSPGWLCTPNNSAGSACTLALGTLAAGSSASRTFAVQLAAAFPSNPPSIDNTACSSTTTGGDPANNNCDGVSTPPAGNPDLRTTKRVVTGSGEPGDTLVYSLVVANLGTQDAAGVQLTETVPALSTFLPGSSSAGWSCSPGNEAGSRCTLPLGTLAAGASASRTFAVQLAATFPSSPPSIDNTACASSATAGDPAGNDCGSVATPPGGSTDVGLTKTVQSGNGDPGSVLVYQLVVSNAGTRDAAAVVVQETVPQLTTFLPAGSSPAWSCAPDGNAGSWCTLAVGPVAAGGSSTFTFAVQVASTFPPSPPSIDNTACVSTTAGGDLAGNDCGSTSTPPGGNPDVRLVKSVASGSAAPGSELVYQLVVSNVGTQGAGGVVLEETVPQLTSFLPVGSSPGWTCTPDNSAGSSCTLAVGTVEAGSSATFTFAVQVAGTFPPNPPSIDNTACVSTTSGGDPAGNDCGSTSTPPGGSPDLRLVKSVASGDATPGRVLVYQLVVSNVGAQGAGGVVLAETVPQLTTFLAAGSSPGWACTPDNSAGSSCTLAVGTVEAGSSATFTFAVQVASSFPPNPPSIDNTACVSTTSGGDPAGNDCGSTSTPPGGSPDLVLSKALSSGTAVPNGVLVYTLIVRNRGSREATGVVLVETVAADSVFEASGSSSGWSCSPDGSAGSECRLAVGTVAAGGLSSHTFAVRLGPDLPSGATVGNTACVEPANDSAEPLCTTVIVDPPGAQTLTDVEVAMAVDRAPLPGGGPWVFTLTLRNASPVQAEGLRVSVALPSFGAEPTDLNRACLKRSGRVIECSVSELTPGDSAVLTWKQALRAGSYTVSAELLTATPEDVDSTPGNGVKSEDDYAEVVVTVPVGPTLHEIPALSTLGISGMVLLLLGCGMFFVRRGAGRRDLQD